MTTALGGISILANNSQVMLSSARTKRGWLGQIIYKQEIVWESEPQASDTGARQAAERELAMRLTYQFPQAGPR